VAVAGELVAFGFQSCGVDTETSRVVIRRLSDGKLLLTAAAGKPRPGIAAHLDRVGSVVIRPDGGVAWISDQWWLDSAHDTIEVHRVDRRGTRILDVSPEISSTSLRLHGSHLSWRHGELTMFSSLR
jgi:hypothetical protein